MAVSELDFTHVTSLNADRLASTTKSRTFQYLDGLTWTVGHHTMKFGADIRHIEAITPLGFFGADNYGTFDFHSGTSFTGQEFADFLIGVPHATSYDVVTADNNGISTHYNFYAQDEWKASERLNLFFGVRYELHPGYHDPSGNIGNFDPSIPLSGRVVYPDGSEANLAKGFLGTFNSCGIGASTGVAEQNGAPCTPTVDNSAAGLPTSLKTVPKLRIMPRFGFAFRPFGDDKTAIRGGFGMFNITQLGLHVLLAHRHAAGRYHQLQQQPNPQWSRVCVSQHLCRFRYQLCRRRAWHRVLWHGKRHSLEGSVFRTVCPVHRARFW